MTSKRLTSGGASLAALVLAFAGFGCDNGDERIDAGTDAGPIPMTDSGPDIDGGPIPMVDGGPATDAGTDAGEVDAGPPPGGGAATSTQIAAVRDAADATDLELPIDGALVTYVKASVGTDPAGFFVQAERAGPAIFVRLDPGVLSPSPERGQVVDFEVTAIATAQGRREVTAIDGWTVESTGHDISFLVENITTLDLVAELDRLESTLVEVDLQVVGSFGFGGTGHRSAAIETEGTSEGGVLRLSQVVEEALEFAPRCLYRVGPTPMWRFEATPQVSAYAVSEVADGECLPPRVEAATSGGPTTVEVRFSRPMAAASIEADGSQFTITPALAITGAELDGTVVTLTTAEQVPDEEYTVTVGAGPTDEADRAVDPAFNSAEFIGLRAIAVLQINELNTNITGQCDLFEIRVVSGGTLEGIRVRGHSGTFVTFPADFVLEGDDLIVIHINGGSATCNGGFEGEGLPPNETESPAEVELSTNYPGAYDFYSNLNTFPANTVVVWIEDAANRIQDAFLGTDGIANPAGAQRVATNRVVEAGEWVGVDGTTLPPANDTPEWAAAYREQAVPGLNQTGTTASGRSLRRTSRVDNDNREDWELVPEGGESSFGSLNPGQL